MAEKATISKKGQVTIPKSIRDKLGLKPGNKISLDVIGKEAILYPEYEEPFEELKKLRKKIQFDEEEIEEMIKSSKEKWSKLS
ncbi:MAG: AbrB/MazE/SpoVT family DNA-binding domain-containing protein [Thermoplasmatota archaeon]